MADPENKHHVDYLKIPEMKTTTKQSRVLKLNAISDKIQEIYFGLEEFNGLDAGGVCRNNLLDAMDGVNTMRRKLLLTEKPLTDDKEKTD